MYYPMVNGGSDKRSELGVSIYFVCLFPMKNGEPARELRIEFPNHPLDQHVFFFWVQNHPQDPPFFFQHKSVCPEIWNRSKKCGSIVYTVLHMFEKNF